MSAWTYWPLMVGWWLLTFCAVAGTSGSATSGLLAITCACYASVLGASLADAHNRPTEETP